MQAQVKYESEIKLPFLGIGRSPSRMLPPFTRRRSGISEAVRSSGGLFDVFVKYAGTEGVGRSHPCCSGGIRGII